jgi:hypothetical protein
MPLLPVEPAAEYASDLSLLRTVAVLRWGTLAVRKTDE